MNLFALSGIINGFIGGIEALAMFIKGKKNFHYLWGIFCVSVLIWGVGSYKIAIANNPDDAIFWWKITYIGVILIPIFLVHFTHEFLEIFKRKFIIFLYIFGIIFLILNLFSEFFIKSVRLAFNQFYYISDPTPFYSLFVLLFLSLVIYSLYSLWQRYKIAEGTKRVQLKYIFVALFFGFMGGAISFLPVYNINIYPFFNITASLGFSIVAYAIVVHRLMDIKMVLRRSSVFLASLSVVLVLAMAVKYIFDSWFYDYSSWADPLILVAALFIFPPIRNRFYKLANKYFFSSLYDSGEVIASLSDKLRTTLETEKIYDFIYQTLANAFHVKNFGILIYNEADKNYDAQYNSGFNIGKQNIFPEDKTLTRMFIKKNQPVITEDVRRLSQFDGNQTVELLKKIGVEILSPLNVKDKTIGLIALGRKESGDMYNDEDLKVLEVVGAQTAIAMENALLYKETKDFSIKLEKEVERATRDLKKANEKLKKLDAAKSEFISIASHQLRTPLTVIKGYVSMMLEGNFGVITKPEQESLEKVFESNERLIQLVENLLNLSRIESGRMQFNYKEIDLNKMAESVVDELSGNAKKKGIILGYKPSAKPLPLLKLDEEKIRQVAMNLVDNGIKYTKQGSVTVKLEQSGNKIKFSVADSGMGIKPEDMPNLFKKFSRGTGTSLVHTEGTGLGLYVARMMIEAHKGRIWAESAGEGRGSIFCFELPVK